jgi:hypothetical protein
LGVIGSKKRKKEEYEDRREHINDQKVLGKKSGRLMKVG